MLCCRWGRLRAEQAGVPVHWYVGDGDSGGFAAGLPSEVLPVEEGRDRYGGSSASCAGAKPPDYS